MTDGLAHSRFGASSAHRWMRCAGSVVLNERVPAQPSSSYAQEGTHAHALLAHCLKEGHDALSYVGKAFVDLPTRLYEADMCEGVQVAIDWVNDIREQFPDARGWAESSVLIPTMNAPGEVFGTADVSIYVPSTMTLYAPDFKFGYKVVDPEENKQLLFYGLGTLFALNVPVDKVVLGIIQPRAIGVAPIRTWETNGLRLWEFLAEIEEAVTACEIAQEEADFEKDLLPGSDWYDTFLIPGEEQCQWCAAGSAGICPAREQRALEITQQTFASVKQVTPGALPRPDVIPLDKIAYILEHGPFIRQWLDDVDTYAFNEAMTGRQVPGRKLVMSSTRRKWEGDPSKIAAKLVEISGLPESTFYEPKLKGIVEVEKAVTRAAVATLTEALGEKPPKADRDAASMKAKEEMAFLTLKQGSGSLSLVPAADPRPAVNPAQVNFQGVSPVREAE